MAQPLVFLCNECGLILSDSSAWVAATPERGWFTVGTCVEGTVSRAPTQSHDEKFEGAYFSLFCGRCNRPKGRFYTSTSRNLDHARDRYTFYVASILCYQLGGFSVGQPVEGELLPGQSGVRRGFPLLKSGATQ